MPQPQLKLYQGAKSNIPANTYEAGALYVTTDTHEMFLDIDSSTRIQISNFVTVATKSDLNNILAPISTMYYYVTASNQFYKYVNNAWKCLGSTLTALIVGASSSATSDAIVSTNGSLYMNLVVDGEVISSHLIQGAGNASVKSTTAGVITISATAGGAGGSSPTVVYDSTEPDVASLGLGVGDVWINQALSTS